jgi:hypothetical protein
MYPIKELKKPDISFLSRVNKILYFLGCSNVVIFQILFNSNDYSVDIFIKAVSILVFVKDEARKTKLDLSNEPPLLGRCCWR